MCDAITRRETGKGRRGRSATEGFTTEGVKGDEKRREGGERHARCSEPKRRANATVSFTHIEVSLGEGGPAVNQHR